MKPQPADGRGQMQDYSSADVRDQLKKMHPCKRLKFLIPLRSPSASRTNGNGAMNANRYPLAARLLPQGK